MTGADSPVMADSSTEATPSTISPSEGMKSPASTRTTSPLRRRSAGTTSILSWGAWLEPDALSTMRLATVSVRAFRSVSACALPRPSAIASAKFANSTVSQSQHVIWNSKRSPGRPAMASRPSRTVVSTLPTSTTNITGFFAIVRGCSFRMDSVTALRTIVESQMDRARACAIRTPVHSSSRNARQSARG